MVRAVCPEEKKWATTREHELAARYIQLAQLSQDMKEGKASLRDENTLNLVLHWLKGLPSNKRYPPYGFIQRHGYLDHSRDGRFKKNPTSSMTRKTPPLSRHEDKMSLKQDRPARATIPVARSQSFGGMSVRSQSSSSSSTSVLGDTIRRSPRLYTRPQQTSRGLGFSFRKSPKIPKIPRPNRALLMFESMKKGIREFIRATQEDILQLQSGDTNTSTAQQGRNYRRNTESKIVLCELSGEERQTLAILDILCFTWSVERWKIMKEHLSIQGKLHETDKQIKAAERYLKKLEFHLSKIDELHECYLVHQQLREGARTMARAFTTSPGNRKQSLTNVKYGYKECSQTLCAIEAQLENMLGTFHCKLKGMAGFARLCPGDVFEVSIRHGPQKWKTKGRIEKNSTQKWDQPEFVFKALVGEVLGLKAVEVRSFKSVLLGQKNCEIKDLFSANPQLMTVSINFNGSLKLSIVITWNPLDGMDETVTFFEAPARTQSTPRRRPVSVLALNGQLSGSYSDLPTGPERRYSSPIHLHRTKDDYYMFGSSTSLPSRAFESHNYQASPLLRSKDNTMFVSSSPQGSRLSQTVLSSALPPTSPTQPLPQTVLPGVLSHTPMTNRDDPASVEEALNVLTTSLEDFLGQYNELQKLEEVVVLLEQFIRKRSRCSSRSSSISVSIESALEAFDFLNTEDTADDTDDLDPSPEVSRTSSIDQILASPESTAKTADSGIESLAKRLSEDTQLGSSLGSSPVPPSTGNEQVDQALLFHLGYCDRLLESLGNFGPLRCREFYALDKLQKQAFIIESLMKIAKLGPDVELHAVMTELTDDKALKEFWVTCVDQNVLYVHPEKLSYTMEQRFGLKIKENLDVSPARVFAYIMAKVLDLPSYDPDKLSPSLVVTFHQFVGFFKKEGGLHIIDSIAKEISLMDRLCSGNTDMVIKAVLTLKEDIPSPTCLKVVGTLLLANNKEITLTAANYLKAVSRNKEVRDKAMVVFVEGLEDQIPDVRGGACCALSVLEAVESIDQLVFVCQADAASTVRRKAKDALFSLGNEGRRAFEDAQLSSHGFQGLQMRK